jgi:hypothetical protein
MHDIIGVLERAFTLGDILVIVRANGAIAEVMGDLRLRRGEEWLTLGQEGASHVHVKTAEVQAVRFAHAHGRNAALQVMGPNGEVLVQLSFRGTNPERAEAFRPDRLEAVRAQFGHLAEVPV